MDINTLNIHNSRKDIVYLNIPNQVESILPIRVELNFTQSKNIPFFSQMVSKSNVVATRLKMKK